MAQTPPTLDYARSGPKRRKLFGLSGLEWLVVTGIIALLVSILLPALDRGRCCGQVKCSSDLRQIGQAIQLYTLDTAQTAYPPDFATLMVTQKLAPTVFICPSSDDKPIDSRKPNASRLVQGRCSYIYAGTGLTTQSDPECIVAFEDPANHGLEGANVLYVDGHVDWMHVSSVAPFVSELEQGYNPPRQSNQSLAQARAMYDRDWKPKLAAMKSAQWAKTLPPPRVDRTPATAPATRP